MKSRLCGFLAAFLACALTVWAAPATGSMEGRVVVSGSLPTPSPEIVTMDMRVCDAQPKFVETFLGDNHGGIGNVAATLEPESPREKTLGPNTVKEVMTQDQCVFVPHILVVPTGSTVEFQNHDSVAHNVGLKAVQNTGFNQVIGPNSYLGVQLRQPEIIPVESSTHPWMKAWIFVTDSPYSQLSDIHGNFDFKDIPAGKYTLALWHEALGTKRIQVKIEPGRVARLNVIWTLSKRQR